MANYEVSREAETTYIVAHPYCEELPKLGAEITTRGPGNNDIAIRYGEDEALLATATVLRGKSFAERVAKFMFKGCLSGLGRHRRLTANRAARKASTEESKEVA